jgi:hypothetical protein
VKTGEIGFIFDGQNDAFGIEAIESNKATEVIDAVIAELTSSLEASVALLRQMREIVAGHDVTVDAKDTHTLLIGPDEIITKLVDAGLVDELNYDVDSLFGLMDDN